MDQLEELWDELLRYDKKMSQVRHGLVGNCQTSWQDWYIVTIGGYRVAQKVVKFN